jgi:hypothetical protein
MQVSIVKVTLYRPLQGEGVKESLFFIPDASTRFNKFNSILYAKVIDIEKEI